MEMLRRALGGRRVPEELRERVPPGQYVTPKMPVMNLGSTPKVATDQWRLRIFGLVAEPAELTSEQFLALESDANVADFHCVTQWSRLNVGWEGVPFAMVVDIAKPLPEATHVMLHCYDGYTTNVDLEALRQPGVMFAYRQDGTPITPEHGGPMRLVVPARYGWKSAKWVSGVELMAGDKPGFWEANGYHMRGDPWLEERFG